MAVEKGMKKLWHNHGASVGAAVVGKKVCLCCKPEGIMLQIFIIILFQISLKIAYYYAQNLLIIQIVPNFATELLATF